MRRTCTWMAIAVATFSVVATASGLGTPAPDVALTGDSGAPIRLADMKGKVVLLDFWASWCVPCRKSFPALDSLQRQFRDQGLAVVAVNVDEQRRDADQFLAVRPHTMAVAFDPQGHAAQAFNLKGMPSTVLLDRHGSVRYAHMGYTEKSIEQFRSEIQTLLVEVP